MLKEALYYARMAWHYGAYVRTPLRQDARRVLAEGLERRDHNFLELVRTGVFENPRTPYQALMGEAGCTFQDLRTSVERDGLEATLETLRREGVYLTHEELKGGPLRRHGKDIPNSPAATANPQAGGGLETVSSGSRSAGLATACSNEYRNYRECYEVLAREELGAKGRATAVLHTILPGPAGLIACSGFAIGGQPAERWWAVGKSLRANGPYATATRLLVGEARLLGCRVPFPAYLERDDFSPVARWIAEAKKNGRLAFLRSGVSSCTRVCSAALDAGLDIRGTVFLTSGEPITPARRRLIQAAGVEAYPRYVASEIGSVGIGCAHLTGNSVHLFADSVAAIVHRRTAPFLDVEVNSLLLTSVNPLASRVLINADLQDAGTLQAATCDCLFSRTGFTTVIQDLQTFGKLSSHGLTLAGEPLVKILEERLPLQFGGAPGDYQLVEQEGNAQLEIRLRMNPRLGAADRDAVRTFFLNEVRALHGGSLTVRTWEATSSIQVEVGEAYRTSTGKIHPLYLAAFGGRNGVH